MSSAELIDFVEFLPFDSATKKAGRGEDPLDWPIELKIAAQIANHVAPPGAPLILSPVEQKAWDDEQQLQTREQDIAVNLVQAALRGEYRHPEPVEMVGKSSSVALHAEEPPLYVPSEEAVNSG